MREIFNKVKTLGINSETDFYERNRLEIFNSVILATLLICLGYLPLMYTNGLIYAIYQNLFLIASMLTCLVLNFKGYVEFSKHMICICSSLYFLCFAYVFGERGQVISFIEVTPMLVAILFDSQKHFKKYLVIILSCTAGCYYFYWNHTPVYDLPEIRYWGASSSFVSVLIIFFIMHYFKNQSVKHEQKITEQATQLKDAFEELNQQNEEISAQRDEIELQKHLVEEHQQEMIDSITYAKRIQNAILPPVAHISKVLPQSFVLYKPKDIVAGDFYWMYEDIENGISKSERNSAVPGIYIAVADCTGHGVPGAMVSVVCSNALNRAVNEFRLKDTGKILDKVTDLVLETFEKSMDDVKDGMDISILFIDNEKKEIHWSGANNPLWYFDTKDQDQLIKITADKQPIGKSDYRKPFSTHKISLMKGGTFYLLTDGYADQFGGPKGKKFKYKQLEEILLSCSKESLTRQSEILHSRFEEWKGSLEQVDDVTIIGIRV